MIKLTKLDSRPVLVSMDAVKYIESTPDTLILFQNGDSTLVRETIDEIFGKAVEYKAAVLKLAQQSAT